MRINAQIPKGVTAGGYVPVIVTIGDSLTVSDAIGISGSNQRMASSLLMRSSVLGCVEKSRIMEPPASGFMM